MSGTVDQVALLKRAYFKLEELQGRLDAAERARHEPLAIVGIGCRFPGGADSPDAFWRLLRDGVDAVRPTPADRWDIEAHYDPSPGVPGKMYSRAGGFLDRVDGFEPQLFGISPREAVGMDPQQRLLLEVAWEALEHAGIAPDSLVGSRTGVFLGICTSDYAHLQIQAGDPTRFDAYYGSGIAHSVASGRLSYVLGLQGPSLSIDTACSSSLVALHLASRSLRAGECRMALVGGVNLILSPENSITFSKSSMLAPDGRCKTFDASADGFAEGEGCAVIALKRLSDAVADGDRVLAVVRGTAINQDGASSGLTAPNGPAQVAVIQEALADGQVSPANVSYSEAHGTGTSLGDPIEVQAMAVALGASRTPDRPLLIGSVKTNLGHLEAAAGLAGVIKVVLALQHREIPRHLHFRTPNPHIPWAELPVTVATELTPWQPIERTRIAGVSAFGFSGTNAHVVLEEAPVPAAERVPEADRPLHVLPLSARTDTALRDLASRYRDGLKDSASGHAFADVCHTAAVGRAQLGRRLAVVAESSMRAAAALDAWLSGDASAAATSGEVHGGDRPRVAFLFTGQGAQYAGMGRVLYNGHPEFRSVLDRCDRMLQERFGRRLLPVMFAEPGSPESRKLDDTEYTQPALYALECGLLDLWRSWGITPSVVLGHSVGEYAAAYAAGVFGLEDGLALIARRASLMQSLPEGGQMAAVFASADRVQAELDAMAASVSIAAINGPANTVISGRGADVERLREAFTRAGIGSKALAVSHAFHSPLMEPMLDSFERDASAVTYRSPQIVVLSNLTGRAAAPGDLTTGTYWRRHVREAVRFSDGVEALRRTDCSVVLEIGPQPMLLGMAKACLPESTLAWLPSLGRGRDDWQQILGSLADLFVRGAQIDWRAVDVPYARHRVALPTYPFERERYWLDLPADRSAAMAPLAGRDVHPLLGARTDSATGDVLFTCDLNSQRVPFLSDHVVHGVTLLPTTAYLEMAAAAGRECLGGDGHTVSAVSILEPLLIAPGGTRIQVVCTPDDGGSLAFRVFSQSGDGGGWKLHASATVSGAVPSETGSASFGAQPEDAQPVDRDGFYTALSARGLEFGPGFRGVRAIWRRDGEAAGDVELPEGYPDASAYAIHPALLDACFQVLAAAVPGFVETDLNADVYMPIAIDQFDLLAPAHGLLRCETSIAIPAGRGRETRTAHVRVFDREGRLVARASGMHLKRADARTLRKRPADEAADWLYRIDWRPQAAAGDAAPGNAQIAAGLAPRATALAGANGVEIYDQLNRDLDELCAAYAADALVRLGVQFTPGAVLHASAVAEHSGVLPRHHRLLTRLLEILAEDGWLRRGGDGWTVIAAPPAADVAALAGRLLATWPQQTAELTITRRCGAQLAAALRGEADPLQLLFPGGDIEGTARIYDASPLARTMHTLASEALGRAIANRPDGEPLRVLEIGAGTGGTTQYLLDALPTRGCEYVFTDVGHAFLARAQRTFADRPFVSCRTLDIERDPAAQGFDPHSFDVVVAANVLHATDDLARALARVHNLLTPGGLLLLVEGTRPQRWFDVTFGLTEGWWRFQDVDLRPSYPLIDRGTWERALRTCGFSDVASIPGTDDGTALTQTAVILARTGAAAADSASESSAWLVFADESGVGGSIIRQLESQGGAAVAVGRGRAFRVINASHIEIDPANPNDYRRALRHVVSLGAQCRGAVHLWSLDMPAAADLSAAALEAAEEAGCRTALFASQALIAEGLTAGRQWCLVTRGVHTPTRAAGAVAHASIWGMAKGLALEHPELRVLRVDLDGPPSPEDAGRVISELQISSADDQVAYRNGVRHVARLTRVALSPAQSGDSDEPVDRAVALELETAGTPDGLAVRAAERRAPGPGEVEVHVLAAALNFRDVLNVLAMRRDDDPLGGECAGTVVAVGPGVDALRPGDAVIVIAPGCFRTYLTVPTTLVFPKPASLSFEQAAAAPLAFLTAHYALHIIGKLERGDRVLIHAAAGGVGLAAVQIAQRAGAEVFGTAGSAEKRAFLASLGVEHVADSRSADFAAMVRERTGGDGVDLVLNSLTGPSIDAGLRVLRSGGRFLEIGKSELRTPGQVAAVNPSAAYYAIDLAEKLHEEPLTVRPIIAELLARLGNGDLNALPVSTFGLTNAADAFRHMARARHIGKVVIATSAASASAPHFRPDATYLITGGLSGLGLEVARWMADNGARHLALLGRRAPSPEATVVIDGLRRRAVAVSVLRADVSDGAQLGAVLQTVRTTMPPLRGVVHSAGVLDDGVVQHQDWSRFTRVMAPKVAGAWQLHLATRDLPLDYFVLFSSASSMLGSAGQSNHAAANAFLDALAHYRRAAGLSALSINWGAWSDIGAAARRDVEERIATHGIGTFTPAQGLRVLGRLMVSDEPQVGVFPVDWSVYAGRFAQSRMPAFFADVVREAKRAAPRSGAARADRRDTPAEDVTARLRAAPPHRRRPQLGAQVEAIAVRVLALPSNVPVDRRLPLSDMGLDSLMAVEMRNALGTTLGITLPATLLFDYPTLDVLTDYLFQVLALEAPADIAPAKPTTVPGDLVSLVESLSDEDIERMFSQGGVNE